MSEAKKTCQLDGCKRAASTLCFCCKKNVCTRHFTEHIDAVKAQIDPLANEINSMVEKIQGLTIEQITETYFAELQQWKIDMHQLIDEIFLVKIKEVEDLIELNKNKFVEHKKQQSETIMKIQDEVKQLVEDGDATFEQIQLLKNQLATVETNLTSFRKDFLSVNARVFAQGLITVSSNLNKPSLPPPQTSKSNQTTAQTGPGFGATTTAQSVPIFGATTTAQSVPSFGATATTSVCSNLATLAPPLTGFSFSGFGSNSSNNPQTHASPLTPTLFGGFAGTPLNVPSPFGVNKMPSVGSGNNQPAFAFGNNANFPFNNNGQK